MVEVFKSKRGPRIEVHHERREMHGNGIAVRIYGELKIAAHEVVYAYEMGLNTLQVLSLTVEGGNHTGYTVKKWIYHKGEYDNYASIDIIDTSGTCITAGNGPDDGSVWLDFIALGE